MSAAASLWDHHLLMGITVLIVDDHEGFRSSASSWLEAGGFTVVAGVAGGEEAIDAVRHLHPDVVLLDLQLPGVDGFAVAERLAASFDPPPKVVLTSSRDAASYGSRIAAAAACGFLAKRDLSGASLAALVE
jgi:DNA-binding NarL/FixJ family response regulator